MDGNGQFVTPVLSFHARWKEIERPVTWAREGAAPGASLQAVMEPTGMAWFVAAVALQRMNVTSYLVNGRRTSDLRRFPKRHSSSDRISAQVLAKMPLMVAESLYPLEIHTTVLFACQTLYLKAHYPFRLLLRSA